MDRGKVLAEAENDHTYVYTYPRPTHIDKHVLAPMDTDGNMKIPIGEVVGTGAAAALKKMSMMKFLVIMISVLLLRRKHTPRQSWLLLT